MKKYIKYIPLLLLISCSKEDAIKREIKLKEARKGFELVNFSITQKRSMNDTSAIYFTASIKTTTKDSVIEDSIFFVKNADGVLLPFSSNPQNGNK
ncbi:MAG: hypothetical protein M3004_11500 [Bacteroidota bacterium]|nr:hypothetical protein [Bacteroidota bacterium]